MNTKKHSFLLISIFILSLILSKTPFVNATTINPISKEITISATIGKPKLSLFGYAPSRSKVMLSGIGVSDTTTATSNGYYEFTNVFLPSPINKKLLVYPEICLTAVDKMGLTTQPTCIPPLPLGDTQYNIGPVILSPTFQLEKGSSNKNDTVKAFGITTPDSRVSIYLAKEREKTPIFSVIKNASAYYIPTYQIQSDKHGYFEFSLPTDSTNIWKLFASTKVLGANSPKSNTLTFRILSSFLLFIKRLMALIALLKPYLIYLVIFIEILIILFLMIKLRRNYPDRHLNHKSNP